MYLAGQRDGAPIADPIAQRFHFDATKHAPDVSINGFLFYSVKLFSLLCRCGFLRTGFALGLFVVAVDDHVAVESPDGQKYLSRNESIAKFTA